MQKRRTTSRVLECLEHRLLLAANPVISEFMARNSNTLVDGDGNSSDWIEILNRGDELVDLDGWYLTDDSDQLTKWQFPSHPLDAGERLVVFASGAEPNYIDPAGYLHSNFKLQGAGEFLALVQPDGTTIASQFAPEFPAQKQDVSYGLETGVTISEILADERSSARLLIPEGEVGSWTQPDFDDGMWLGNDISTSPAVGFEILEEPVLPDGLIKALGFEEFNPSETAWESVSMTSVPITGNADFAEGQFGNALQFDGTTWIDLGDVPDSMRDGFSLLTWIRPGTRNRTILSGLATDLKSGFWLGNNSDGPWLGIAAGADASEGSTGSWKNVNAPDTMTESNAWYHLAATFDPTDTVQEVKLYLNGEQLTDEVSGADLPDGWMGDPHGVNFRIGLHNSGSFPFEGGMDDVAVFDRAIPPAEVDRYFRNGVISNGPVFESEIETNLFDDMHGKNASLLMRIPFSIDEPEEFNSLHLNMAYDDGFVAYLNGTEVLRRNAPIEPQWNSNATDERPAIDALSPIQFDITEHLSLLNSGSENILAIHGLNAAANDANFFLKPELVASQVTERFSFFPTPTPDMANNEGVIGFVEDITFSVNRGFYDTPIQVEIATDTPNAQIRYTLDGSPPSAETGVVYESPIDIESTSTLRAAAFLHDYLSSNVDTNTYLFLQDVIQQPSDPEGFPSTWDRYQIGPAGRPVPADYEMNPTIISDHADTILDDLKSLPTMSIVMDNDDLFGAEDGIYTHPFINDEIRERPTSIEWMEAGGGREFQIDAGIRLFGGWSRHFWATPKKGFALKFKQPYGPTKLEFPIFAENQIDSQVEPTDGFDTVLLRGVFSDAWPDAASPPQYLRDLNTRVTQLAMGQLSSHGTWVHLYLNGLYWGIYNPSERPDASFLEAYLGGEKTEYDAVKHRGLCGPGCASNDSFEVIDGGEEAQRGFRAALDAARRDLRDPENYEAFKQLVDVENLADYMLLQHYVGNVDWPHKNWYANRKREGGEGWKFYVWDSEYTLRNVNDSRLSASNANTPAFLFSRARRNSDFQLMFADRVQKHLFNDGVLQPQANIDRYLALAEEIEGAIKAEAARWGDNGHTRKGRTNFTFQHWERVRDDIVENYFPRRHAIAIRQLGSLFPDVTAPSLEQFGGMVEAGFALTMTAEQGTIYYTVDGTDPQDAGQPYTGPVPIPSNLTVKARALHDDEWSPLTEASFEVAESAIVGDFNFDRLINATDISLFCEQLHSDDAENRFDLNGDGQVDSTDFHVLILDVLNTTFGDANLDGVFDSRDFVSVFQVDEFEDDLAGNSTWSEGDWDCDGDFTTRDFVLAFQFGGYTS